MNEEKSLGLFIFLIVLGLIAGVLTLWLGTPYFLFYLLPFSVVSILFGSAWFFSSRPSPTKRTYENLAFFYPMSMAILSLFLDVLKSQDGDIHGWRVTYVDSYHRLFNQFYSFWHTLMPGVSQASLQSYDYTHVKWIMISALAVGAPSWFLWLVKRDAVDVENRLQRERESVKLKYESQMQEVRESWQAHASKAQNKVAESNLEVMGLKREITVRDKEIESLRLREKYYTGGSAQTANTDRPKPDLEFL